MAFILIQDLFTCLCTAKCQATFSVMVREGEKSLFFLKQWLFAILIYYEMETINPDNSYY